MNIFYDTTLLKKIIGKEKVCNDDDVKEFIKTKY